MRWHVLAASLLLAGTVLAGCRYEGLRDEKNSWLPDCSDPATSAGPDAFGSLVQDGSTMTGLFDRARSYKACQTLTIGIQEETKATEKAKTNTERTTSSEAHLGAMVGLVGELAGANPNWGEEAAAAGVSPGFGIEGGSGTSMDGGGETSREGVFTTTVTVMVVRVLDNGLLEIEGGRQIAINHEVQILRLHGYVDPRHIAGDDTVPSWRIAEPSIALMGQGVVGDKQIAPWLQRALDRVFPL